MRLGIRYGSSLLVAGMVVVAAHAAPLHAQATGSRSAPGVARQGGAPGNRVQLEREVRARIHDMMRQRMGLDEAQTARLERTLRTFEDRRRVLLREEREARMTLRAAMGGGATRAAAESAPDDSRISAALDTLFSLQRRRIDLAEAEQRELATFLTPLQRAQYFALQENLRRVLEERGGPPAGNPGRPGPRRPPGAGGDPPR